MLLLSGGALHTFSFRGELPTPARPYTRLSINPHTTAIYADIHSFERHPLGAPFCSNGGEVFCDGRNDWRPNRTLSLAGDFITNSEQRVTLSCVCITAAHGSIEKFSRLAHQIAAAVTFDIEKYSERTAFAWHYNWLLHRMTLTVFCYL